jgi:hypothetical protein
MAAARQKEMNVSITEDATISRTRSDGGATIVRVDAIYRCAGMFLPLKVQRAHFLVRPWLSLVLLDTPVNKETQTLVNVMEKGIVSRFIHRRPKDRSNSSRAAHNRSPLA